MTNEERFEEFVEVSLRRARRIWTIHGLVVSSILWFLLSGWWLLVIPVYLSLSYQVSMYIAANSIMEKIPDQLLEDQILAGASDAYAKICKKLEEGEVEPGPELYELMQRAGLSVGIVDKTSEEKVGTYQGSDIFEWVDIFNPHTKERHRYFFEQVGQKDTGGNVVLPHIEGKLTACINDIIYVREVEPAQSQ